MKNERNLSRWRDTLVHDEPSIESATRLLRRYDADTISFQAKQKVWRKLNEQVNPKPEWSIPRIGLAVVVLGCAIYAGLEAFSKERAMVNPFVESPKEVMHFSAVTGTVKVREHATPRKNVEAGFILNDSTNIKTMAASAATLELPQIGQLQLGSQSEIHIARGQGFAKVNLFRGGILANVRPRNDRSPLEVHAGNVRITVVGTIFEVNRSLEKGLVINVSEGVVEVSILDEKHLIQAGQEFIHQESTKVIEASELSAEEAPATDRNSAKEDKQPLSGIPESQVVVQPAIESQGRSRAAARRAVPSRLKRKPSPSKPQPKPKTSQPEPEIPKRPPLKPSRVKAIRPMIIPEKQLSEVKIPSDLLQYQSASEETDALQAIKMFDSVAESESLHAEVAAHQSAKIVIKKGDDKEALRRYQVIRDRFAGGIHAKATATALIALRLKHCKFHEGRGDLNRFLRENPKNQSDKDLAFLSGELFRRTEKYQDAIREYDRSMGSQYDEDALYFKAWALLALDKNSTKARTLLDAYLEQYPQGRYRDEISQVLKNSDELPTSDFILNSPDD